MAAPESTKFQVNFKAPDGTLINLYAANKEELEALLSTAQDFSALIGSVSQSFSGARVAAPVSSAAPVGPVGPVGPVAPVGPCAAATPTDCHVDPSHTLINLAIMTSSHFLCQR